MTEPQQPYRLPQSPPEPVSEAEREAFAALVAESLPAVRASAQTWRTGLTALITLITAAVVIQGQRATAELSPGWRLAVTLLIGGGLAACAAGLWQVLGAEAGSRTTALTLSDIHQRHGSVAAYQAALANLTGKRLHHARNFVAAALILLFAGTVATWWAPATQTPAPTYLKITHGTDTTCGVLQSAEGGRFQLTVPGAAIPVEIAISDITTVGVVSTCS